MNQKTVFVPFEDGNSMQIGDNVILKERVSAHGISNFALVSDCGGIGGNLDHKIKRYHGWRGTTNNIATYAHGVRKIVKIRPYKDGFKVTVGKDLHPEWD